MSWPQTGHNALGGGGMNTSRSAGNAAQSIRVFVRLAIANLPKLPGKDGRTQTNTWLIWVPNVALYRAGRTYGVSFREYGAQLCHTLTTWHKRKELNKYVVV